MTDPAKRTESVKIEKMKIRGGLKKIVNINIIMSIYYSYKKNKRKKIIEKKVYRKFYIVNLNNFAKVDYGGAQLSAQK